MIPVRIAANLTPSSTDGVRWVLVDDTEAVPVPPPVDAVPPAQPQAEVRPRRRGTAGWIKLAVLCAGLAGAAGTTHCIVDEYGPGPVRPADQTIAPGAAR
jgi:hypothetical protein